MGTVNCCLIILSIVAATSAMRQAFCPHDKNYDSGALSDHILVIQLPYHIIPIIGQTQELRCHVPFDRLGKSKVLWFKAWNFQDSDQVPITNTWDGRLTVSESVTEVHEKTSHSCWLSDSTTFFTSILSIRNFDKADYGRYNCRVVPNNDSASTMGKGPNDYIGGDYYLHGPVTSSTRYVERRLTKSCKTHLTCKVLCYSDDCCKCDKDSCRMLLLKDGKMVASTTSVESTVESDHQTFKSTLKISVDGPEDFGLYDCVLRQLVVDCVDGSKFENSWAGMSLGLREPEETMTQPQKDFVNSGEVLLSCLFKKSHIASIHRTAVWKTWEVEVVLRKDGKDIAAKESSLSPDNTVKESFLLKKSVYVYGQYMCVIRQVHHGCIKQAWFMTVFVPDSYLHLDLNPRLISTYLRRTSKHTCAFLVQRGEAYHYAIAVTLYGKEVFRLDVDIRPLDDKEVDIVSANFEIEVKDPMSFGIYDCILEKNGLPDVRAKDAKVDAYEYYGDPHFPNTFQLTPSTIWQPSNPNRIHMSLGTAIYLPCNLTDYGSTSIDKVYRSPMWWYRNGDRIDSDDKLTAFISQRYLVSGKVVFFLWYTVKVENAAAFGTYECRYEGDKDFFRKSLQKFSLEPENWEVQAQDFFDTVKVLTDRQRLYEEGIRWRDNALSDAYYIIFVVVLVIVVSIFDRLISWIRQKFLERDIRVTLGNIQQMDALKGCGEGSHRYDVFISHSSVDASWVQGDLLDNLESNGYTVCLDTRDFMAGKPVLSNIATAIYQSRKVIVVMSKNFLKSGWCWHELVLTYQRKLDQNENCVVVVKYDDCKIPKEIALRTYLDWTEPMARETFWAKLHEWLGPPSPPLDLRNEEDVEEVEEWFECQDSETCQQDESNPADSQEKDDFVLRQNIPNAGCD